MDAVVSRISFWFALILSLGSLLIYLSLAYWNKLLSRDVGDASVDFNLGLPNFRNRETLFSMSLVAAGTSLSTVFVFFLTAGPLFGWWLVLSPVMFAIGNFVLFRVYTRIQAQGYFNEANRGHCGVAGLIPYLGQALTGSNRVGWLLVVMSLLNLLAVLCLELIVGVKVFGYLASHTFQTSLSSPTDFVFFVVAVLLLLGYVFVGGFRAVVASDIWQMKAMQWAIVLSITSLAVLVAVSRHGFPSLNILVKNPPSIVLWGFVLNVILANLFSPLSQEASWQRFRAFSSNGTDIAKAMRLSISRAVLLWVGLIILAFGMMLVLPANSSSRLSSMPNVLEALRTLNDWWFPLCVFPVLTVASLSAMYSTADTCVSAILYLIEYSRVSSSKSREAPPASSLRPSYYVSMTAIFFAAVGVYFFVRVWFDPTILQLIFSVFSNLVIIAPTVITAALLPPPAEAMKARAPYIVASIIIGFIAYWTSSIGAIVMGPSYLWLSQLSIVIGLTAALLPVVPLWLDQYPAAQEGA